jgi:3-oxoacyl-[acyl-carrier protein] reductase
MVNEGLKQGNMQEVLAGFAAKAALQRTGVPDDIAHVATFLASVEAGFLTGQSIAVDGGRMDFLSQSA